MSDRIDPDKLSKEGNTDAQLWAKAWCQTAIDITARGGTLIDEGWMIGWFANAIRVGYESGYSDGYQQAMDYTD